MLTKLQDKKEFEKIFELIPQIYKFHNTNTNLYKAFDKIIVDYISTVENETFEVHPFVNLKWPNISLGNLDSYNYFSMGEMIIYSYYWNNRDKYNIVFDVGGHIGIDTVILDKFGYEVYSFEPDPQIFKIMESNVKLNNCSNTHLYSKGMSDKVDILEFVRVKGNTTSSHILGEREFYGEVDKFKIETMKFEDVGVTPDLMKINIEGHEKTLVPSIPKHIWDKCDVFIELHGEDCCKVIFKYFNKIGINIFSQKIGWDKVTSIDELPLTYKEGLIFVSSKSSMSW